MSKSPLKIAKAPLAEKQNLLRNTKLRKVEALVAKSRDVEIAEQDYKLLDKIQRTPKNVRTHRIQ